MATFSFGGSAGGNEHRLDWDGVYDDTARTVTLTATHTQFSGAAELAPPQQAVAQTRINTGQVLAVDLLTNALTINDVAQGTFDATQGSILNTGPHTRANVRLRTSGNRAGLVDCSTLYQPPA